jgi:hypothetical protein
MVRARMLPEVLTYLEGGAPACSTSLLDQKKRPTPTIVYFVERGRVMDTRALQLARLVVHRSDIELRLHI